MEFKPTVRDYRISDFQSGSLSHSGTSPVFLVVNSVMVKHGKCEMLLYYRGIVILSGLCSMGSEVSVRCALTP